MIGRDQDEYVRLVEGESVSPKQKQGGFFFSGHSHIQNTHILHGDSDDDLDMQQALIPAAEEPHRGNPWWSRLRPTKASHSGAPAQSNYLTLIPLSDSRLRPPRTRLIVATVLFLCFLAVSTVFVLVPRGVTVGTIQVRSSQISFNTSKSTYQILLTATLPVYNPNYLSVQLSGTVNVSFYDQQAGYTVVHPVRINPGANPQVVSVDMDASSVPQKYLFTIYTQCFTFPEQLIFFLTGNLQASYYTGQSIRLPLIDNYFIISCNQSPDKGGRGHDKDKDKGKDKQAVGAVSALPAQQTGSTMAATGRQTTQRMTDAARKAAADLSKSAKTVSAMLQGSLRASGARRRAQQLPASVRRQAVSAARAGGSVKKRMLVSETGYETPPGVTEAAEAATAALAAMVRASAAAAAAAVNAAGLGGGAPAPVVVERPGSDMAPSAAVTERRPELIKRKQPSWMSYEIQDTLGLADGDRFQDDYDGISHGGPERVDDGLSDGDRWQNEGTTYRPLRRSLYERPP